MIALLILMLAVQRQVPDATAADRALAQLEISLDGQTMTIRGVASDALRICVRPKEGQFGPTRCFSVGAIRRGEVRER